MTKLVVFSICKDESATIGELIDRIPREIEGVDETEIVVISDGSTDETAEIARERGAIVIEGTVQHRLAHRFQQAVEIALGRGADVAVNIDGDLQFDPADIPDLVRPILAGAADFVAADRFTDPCSDQKRRPKDMPATNYWGNRLGARVVGRLSGEDFADVTCGFRAYNREALLCLNINGRHTYTYESFQILAHHRLEIAAMPVDVVYYPDRTSRVVKSIGSFVAGSALNITRSYRDFAPLRFFAGLGLVPFILGVALAAFVAVHWLRTGLTRPYTSVGILGVYLISLGLVIFVVGLIGDMLGRSARNQEKILRELKTIRHGSTPAQVKVTSDVVVGNGAAGVSPR
jgi:glycosyltransferase involved in cell wall biosynthesis